MESSLHGLEVSSENVDCCGLVTLKGEVDVANAPLVRSHIEVLTSMSTKHLVIDCAELNFIDSSGLHILEHARQGVEGNLALVRQRKPVQRLFEIVGLSSEFPGFDTVEEAREYLHRGGKRQFIA
ncbi:MAG TPA: STAS domain-containing protein [Acidimicrobiia bacterium]|nr:STAS domain-containing protein [Acidimicrobiia bacterium]